MGDDKDKKEKDDLTLLEDISDYLHELNDPDLDSQLEHGGDDHTPVVATPEIEEEETDFTEFKVPIPGSEKEESSESFESDTESSFEETQDDNETSFGESESGFDENSESETSFGDDSEGSFSDSESSFEENAESSFESEPESSFEETSQSDSESSFETETSFDENDNESPQEEIETSFEDVPAQEEPKPTSHLDKIKNHPVTKDEFGSHEETVTLEKEKIKEEIKPAYIPPENFNDIKAFTERSTTGVALGGGNPPFSLILKKIKYKEDASDILNILKEYKLCTSANEKDYEQGLQSGSMIISQISEYAAIYLAHKFRRFDLDILFGPSEEIHPSLSYDVNEKGLVNKANLQQNRFEFQDLSNKKTNLESIIITTNPYLENFKINRYISIISEHEIISEDDLENIHQQETLTPKEPTPLSHPIDITDKLDETFEYSLGLMQIYHQLARKLKVQCLKLGGNAVIGVNFQTNPLIKSSPKISYKISCIGNVVWVSPDRENGRDLTR